MWITELSGSRVSRINPDDSVDVVVSGADAAAANGVVYDPDRKLLFFTNYQAGRVARVSVDGNDIGSVEEVGTIPGAATDGLVLDACGNIYAVDQGNSALYRFRLDDLGVAQGAAEMLASFPQNVANAQFGWGEGWDPESLYLAGNPGVVYQLELGVPGKPIPLP